MNASPIAMSNGMRLFLCLWYPFTSASAPTKAIETARTRCVLSSEGRKCAETAERESTTGVSKQWTMQKPEAQMPI